MADSVYESVMKDMGFDPSKLTREQRDVLITQIDMRHLDVGYRENKGHAARERNFDCYGV